MNKENAPLAMEPGNHLASPATQSPKPRPSGRRWLWLPILAVLGVGAWYLWSKNASAVNTTPAADAKAGKKGGAGVVPVVAAKAWKGDIGVYITSPVSSVTPVYTVTIKSRVDGQLMKVHYNEGDMVQAGDLLVEIDPRPYQAALDQAEGQLARDQAVLANGRVDLDRYTKLLAQKAVPEQTLATQQALVAQYEGVVKTDQAQIESAKVNLAYCSIAAPITGRVGLRLVDPGNIVHAADTNGLLVITQIQPISVIFTVAEDDLPVVLGKLAAGEHLRADAYDRADTKKIATGTLATVDNQIDPTTGTLRFRANFDNADKQLFPNQFVNIHLLVQEKHGITLAPTGVIQRTTNSTYVDLVKDDHTVTIRQIVPGVTDGDNTEIVSGVSPGDILVMTGVDKLTEGGKVNVQLSGPQAATAVAKSGGRKK
jgi:multidrug efflux system membrane fusion protein